MRDRVERQKRIAELEKSSVYWQASPAHVVEVERQELDKLYAEERAARKDEAIILAIDILNAIAERNGTVEDIRDQIEHTRDALEDVVETSDLPSAPRERKMVRQARVRARSMS